MNKKSLLATAVVATLSTGMVTSAMSPVFAAEGQAKDAATQKQQQAEEQDFIKVSEDALMTMHSVRGARLALFNGMPDKARDFTDNAATRLAATMKDADKYALDIKASAKDGDDYVPFDANLAVAETVVASEEKRKVIAKANEHLHKGETKKAVEVLKLGAIDVGLTTHLIPLKVAKAHIADAAKLIGEHRYYEANIALKAVEDAVVTESFEIDSVPALKATS